MFELRELTQILVEENDPEDFKMPYRVYGKFEREVLFSKYKALENLEKPTILYPGIAKLL